MNDAGIACTVFDRDERPLDPRGHGLAFTVGGRCAAFGHLKKWVRRLSLSAKVAIPLLHPPMHGKRGEAAIRQQIQILIPWNIDL